MTSDEVGDLWRSVQRIGPVLEKHVGATSLTLVIQDGPQSGQTIDHVHVHILPRKGGDFTRNDEVYDRIEDAGARWRHASTLFALPNCGADLAFATAAPRARTLAEVTRVARTAEEMAAEATVLRALFEPHERFSDTDD